MKQQISYVKMLWVGIGLWLVAAVLRIVLAQFGLGVSRQEVMLDAVGPTKDMVVIGVWFVMLCLLGPLLEEFLFRYWTRSRKRWLTIGLFSFMGCYMAVSAYWWLGVFGFALCLLIDITLRGKPGARTVALMLTTSLLFAVTHITGFSSMGIDATLSMAELFGLGMVTCWLMQNFDFWHAFGVHALNNTAALVVAVLMPAPAPYVPTEVHFDTPLYSASLRPAEETASAYREVDDSTVVFEGHLPIIALRMVEQFNPDLVARRYSPTEWFKGELAQHSHKWEYTLTFHDTIPYKNAPWLVADLARHSRLKIDTTYEYMYVIGIDDPQKLDASTGSRNSTLAALATDLGQWFDCPMVLEKGTNEYYPIEFPEDLLLPDAEIEKLPALLSERLGLYLYRSNVHKIQAIRFYESDD